MSEKVKVRLTHTCNAPEHPGTVGDVVLVDADLATSWIDRGGAVLVPSDTRLTADQQPGGSAAVKKPDAAKDAADKKPGGRAAAKEAK